MVRTNKLTEENVYAEMKNCFNENLGYVINYGQRCEHNIYVIYPFDMTKLYGLVVGRIGKFIPKKEKESNYKSNVTALRKLLKSGEWELSGGERGIVYKTVPEKFIGCNLQNKNEQSPFFALNFELDYCGNIIAQHVGIPCADYRMPRYGIKQITEVANFINVARKVRDDKAEEFFNAAKERMDQIAALEKGISEQLPSLRISVRLEDREAPITVSFKEEEEQEPTVLNCTVQLLDSDDPVKLVVDQIQQIVQAVRTLRCSSNICWIKNVYVKI